MKVMLKSRGNSTSKIWEMAAIADASDARQRSLKSWFVAVYDNIALKKSNFLAGDMFVQASANFGLLFFGIILLFDWFASVLSGCQSHFVYSGGGRGNDFLIFLQSPERVESRI